MDVKEYLANMDEVNTAIYSPKKDLKMKIQLIAPFKRMEDLDFTLVLGGTFYASLEIMGGIYLNEFIKVLNKNLFPLFDKKSTSNVIDEATRNIKKIFKDESVIDINKKLNEYLDEITRYMKGQNLTKVFKKISPYKYSLLYRRPAKVCVMSDMVKSSIHEMTEVLNSLEYQKVLTVIYPSICKVDDNFPKYLEEKKCFYNVFLSDGEEPNNLLLRLASAGLDEIIVPLYSLNPDLEMKLSNHILKNVLALIKAINQVGIKVSVYTKISKENSNYLELLKYLHTHDVRSFSVEFSDDLEDRNILLKQINYYTRRYCLELKVLTKGILKVKEMDRLGIYPAYKENMVSTYYTKGDFMLYADNGLKYRLGSLSMEKIQSVYNKRKSKKLRRESLKRR